MNLRKRVRTVAPAEPGAGAVATLDDPRLGAVSAALARLRPQLVPDPDAPDTGDDYLAETEYGATTQFEAPEPPVAPAPASIGSRWAAALGRIQPPVRRAGPAPTAESIAEPTLVAQRQPGMEPAAEPTAEPVAGPVAETVEPVAEAVVAAEPTPEIQSESVPEPSSFSELHSVLAAVIEAEAPAAEAPVAAVPVAEFDVVEATTDDAPDDDRPMEGELVSAGIGAAPWTAELDGTLLPRAPLHRSRLPHRLTGAFNRPRRRRRRH